ncbi:MAG: DUF4147 domain-containing protein [Myxococcales bacterium]|nr:DUF4147 domain-containing protein [Myxococcales bacterium]
MSSAAWRSFLENQFLRGLEAVEPGACVERALERRAGVLEIAGRACDGRGRLHVLAVGKAALPMIAAVVRAGLPEWARGLAVTPRRGEEGGLPNLGARGLQILEASHPIPDAASAAAGRAARAFTRAVPEDAHLLVLLSGGATSLLAEPSAGLSIEDAAAATRWLLASGLDIAGQNAVRKHLFAAGGGRLAEERPRGPTTVLAVSDVLDDDWAVIGSGPFAPDPSTYASALDQLAATARADAFPHPARRVLEAGMRGEWPESPKPGAPCFREVRSRLIARNRDAIDAVLAACRAEGARAVALMRPFRGEARSLGWRFAALGRALAGGGAPVVVCAGGESTVTLGANPGRGGRNQELALAAALGLEGDPRVALLAAGSDGIDGPTDAAGAVCDGTTCAAARRAGRDPALHLERHDAYELFRAAGGLLLTGATGTNVADLVLVGRAG